MVKYGVIPREHQLSELFEAPFNMWRIIWSSSRYVRVFRDGVPEIHPVYFDGDYHANPGVFKYDRSLNPQVGECWLVEKWLPAQVITGGTREMVWNADPMNRVLGPYPRHGWYEFVTTLSCNPMDGNFDWLIGMATKRVSDSENYNAIMAKMDAEAAARASRREAIINDIMRPYGADPYVAYGGGQGSKTDHPFKKSAKQAGLPGVEGATSTFIPKHNPVYEVKIKI